MLTVGFLMFMNIGKFSPHVQLVLLSRATGSISSGNLSAFVVIGSKLRKISGDDIVTIGNEESRPWQHRIFIKSETL